MVNDPKGFPICKNLDVIESILMSNPRSSGECPLSECEPESTAIAHLMTEYAPEQ
jgi:hypothetical protein